MNKEVFSDYDIKKNYLNIDIYRKFIILNKILQTLYVSIEQTRESLIISNIKTLNHLKNVVSYLIDNPLLLYINVDSITVPFKEIENNNLHIIKKQYYYYKRHVKSLILKIQFMPVPIITEDRIRKLLNEYNEMTDPLNKYIPETDDYDIFKRYILSNEEIIKKLKNLTLLNFQVKVNEIIETLPSINEDKYINTLRYLIAKYLYEIIYAQSKLERSIQDETIVSSLSSMKLHELGFPVTLFDHEFLLQTSLELFQNPLLNGTCSDLLCCYFNTFPLDTLLTLYKIHLKMMNAIAILTNMPFDSISDSDLIFVFWKSLFIASQVPNPRYILSTLSHLKSLSLLPENLLPLYNIVNEVLETILQK